MPVVTYNSWAEAKHRVFPWIRPRHVWTNMALSAELQGESTEVTSHVPLGEHLALGLMVHHHMIREALPFAKCAQWQVSVAEALETAVENVEALSTVPFKREGNLFVSPWQDDHDAARLVLIEQIAALPVKGNPVAVPTEDNHLVVTGSEDPQGLTGMMLHVEKLAQRRRFIGFLPVELVNDAWRPFHMKSSHPEFARFQKFRIAERETAYGRQAKLLDEGAKKNGDETFAASFNIVELKGVPHSFTAWTRGKSLLPKTDLVFIVLDPADPKNALPVRWDDLKSHAGPLLKRREGLYPERYEVSWPVPDDVLEALRPLAIKL